MTELAARILAQWRRQGKGIWHVTIVIDGYDEVFSLRYPGSLRKRAAAKLARKEIAQFYHEKLKHVHVSKIERMSA